MKNNRHLHWQVKILISNKHSLTKNLTIRLITPVIISNSLNLGKGDVFNLHLPNCPAFLILWFAGMRLGAVMMPTNVLSSEKES